MDNTRQHVDTILQAITEVEGLHKLAYVDIDHLETIFNACVHDPKALEAVIAIVRAAPTPPFKLPK